jgi:hypothetical protein
MNIEDRAALRTLDLLRRLPLESIVVVLILCVAVRAFDDHASLPPATVDGDDSRAFLPLQWNFR